MNFATKRHLDRRTFLRGTGTALALPFLDAMVPAFATPDKQLYPEYDALLLDSMLRSTRSFITELITQNLSTSNLIQSDFAMLNARLAHHYNILGVTGLNIQKVKLPPTTNKKKARPVSRARLVIFSGINPNSEVRGALGGARLGCTRRWGSQWLYQIDTAPDLPAACAANDGGECGASNFGVWD